MFYQEIKKLLFPMTVHVHSHLEIVSTENSLWGFIKLTKNLALFGLRDLTLQSYASIALTGHQHRVNVILHNLIDMVIGFSPYFCVLERRLSTYIWTKYGPKHRLHVNIPQHISCYEKVWKINLHINNDNR